MKYARNLILAVAGSLLVTSNAMAWEVPGCRDAFNKLTAKNALPNISVMIKNDCPVMYRADWVLNRAEKASGEVAGCRAAWNALQSKDAMAQSKFLVTRNCPVIYRKGWRRAKVVILQE